MKKFTVLASLLLIISMFNGFETFMANDDFTENTQTSRVFYSGVLRLRMIDSRSAEVTGYKKGCNPDKIIIPSVINNNIEITSIASNAFYECPANELVFQGKINLSPEAISHCRNLKFVKFSGGIGKIDHSAFLNCPSLYKFKFYEGADISYEDSVKGCENLNKTLELEKAPSPLHKAILRDDVDEFQEIISQDPKFDINSCIIPFDGVNDMTISSIFDLPLRMVQSCRENNNTDFYIPLISYTAMCGSLNCFKFLIANQANLSTPPPKTFYPNPITSPTAAYSGNIEIVRILDQNLSISKKDLTLSLPAIAYNIYGKIQIPKEF